jgi:PD-(D/E)XK nuclease superfamily
MTENAIAKEIVGAAFRIHTTLGPGLLESVYHAVLAYELAQRGVRTVSQQPIPVVYGTIRWTGRKVSRKVGRTPRTRVKLRDSTSEDPARDVLG